MSEVNIQGLIRAYKGKTNVYTPLVEAVVNSIHAIEHAGIDDGVISIKLKREPQATMDLDERGLPDFESIEVSDNGVGFNEENLKSFDTLYSDYKVDKGAKGFGRFMFLKYFDQTRYESFYSDGDKKLKRNFELGGAMDIIVNEKHFEVSDQKTGTTLFLTNLKTKNLDKKVETVARKLLAKLLVYFINDDFSCPRIEIFEEGESPIILNEYLESSDEGGIELLRSGEFPLEEGAEKVNFTVKIVKIYFPNNEKSKVCLTAHNRVVTESPLQDFIPEFSSDFVEVEENESGEKVNKNYIIKAYVIGDYLDDNVSTQREEFDFPQNKPSLEHPFYQEQIEGKSALIAQESVKDELLTRRSNKIDQIKNYVHEHAPWYKDYLENLDYDSIPFGLNNDGIEMILHKAAFEHEQATKKTARDVLNSVEDADTQEKVEKITSALTLVEKNKLADYVAFRKVILELFEKSLQLQNNGKYETESSVHKIIFPLKEDSDSINYDEHNLWIIDERLNFTEYLASDRPISNEENSRPDIVAFDKMVSFRGDNVPSNPVTIFEFKRPDRDDFADPGSKEDPHDQIVRYTKKIKDGEYKTSTGREILTAQNTPFYGYIICSMTSKVKTWLEEKNYKPMPDEQGYFFLHDRYNLYIEALSWDKLLRDAEKRNAIFFKKLGIS